MADNVSSQNLSILTINHVSPDDDATYYCAYWDPHHDRCSETSKPQNSFNHAASTSVCTTGLLLPHSPSLLSPSAIVSAATQSKHCTDAESHKRAGRDLWRSSSPTSCFNSPSNRTTAPFLWGCSPASHPPVPINRRLPHLSVESNTYS